MSTNDPKRLTPQTLLGQWLPGGYRIDRFIGAGAFAWVYFATTPQGAGVAIKVLQSDTEQPRTLFGREIKVLRQLPKSPYCVEYIDDGLTEEGMPFLVMEYIDGCTLKDAFKFKPIWPVEEASYLMIQLCEALAGLHRLGLAHRDLKPENVMLTRDWQVKLMDFGLVKDAQGLLKLFETEDILTGRDFSDNIDKAMLAGTPEYMAPEQFSDPMIDDETQAKTDTWSDVYSLGLIFYQLLTGQKLFTFRPASQESSAYARALLAYIKARTEFDDKSLTCPAQIPKDLWAVLQISLRQNPKLRHHNAAELGDAIRRYATTGEVDEFRDEEHTFMADMSQFMDSDSPFGSSDSEATSLMPPSAFMSRPRSARPPPPDAPEITQAPKSLPPPIDVAAVQAYRAHRLNHPGGLSSTMPSQAAILQAQYQHAQSSLPPQYSMPPQSSLPPQMSMPPNAQMQYQQRPPTSSIPSRPGSSRAGVITALLVGLIAAVGGAAIFLWFSHTHHLRF